MSKLETRFEEDRALRDKARKVLLADIESARTDFSAKGIADRIGGRVGDGAKDVYEVAKIHTNDNRGIIAIVIGALLVWLGREPILEALGMVEEVLEEALDEAASEVEEALSGDTTETIPEVPLTTGDDDEH